MASDVDRAATRAEWAAGSRTLEWCRAFLRSRACTMIPAAIQGKIGTSDLVQEALVDAVRRSGEMPRGRSDELRAWLYRILVLNLAEQRRRFLGTARADVRRELRLEATPPRPGLATLRDGLTAGGGSPSDQAIGREAEGRLAVAIAALPGVEREVVTLRYWHRLEYAEIGLRLGGRSADAARMVHARACRRLFREMGGEAS